MAKKNTSKAANTGEELLSIKRLLILQMLKQGITQKEISLALEMDPGNFSRFFPVKKIIKPSKSK